MNQDTGILLVGHGSRQKYNKEVINKLKDKLEKNMTNYPIEIGFMELETPDIPTAFNKLKNRNVQRIIVNPIFLAHGMHTKIDIPNILRLDVPLIEHQHNHNHSHHHHHRDLKSEPVDFNGEIIYLEPLGSDDKIVEIIEDRIKEHATKNCAILLVGHGSSLPYNNQVIEDIMNKLLDKYDYPIEAGFMRLSKPTIPESFNRLKKYEVDNVIVIPVFLAHGIHTKLDIPTTLGLNPPEIPDYPEPNVSKDDIIEFNGNIIYTEPIGADDKIVDIIKKRISKHL